MKNIINQFIKDAGPIRFILYFFAVIAIVLKPDNSAEMSLEGLQFIPTLILPVIAPLLVTGFFLDMLMSRIYSSEQPDDVKRKFRTISLVDLFFAVFLLILWVPYMLAMG